MRCYLPWLNNLPKPNNNFLTSARTIKKLWILSFSLHLSHHTIMQNRMLALFYLLIFRFTCMLLFFHTFFERLILFIYFWSHSVACGILVPRPRIKPVPPELKVQSFNHWTIRKVPHWWSQTIYWIIFFLLLLHPLEVYFVRVSK